jgi:hypothetical protein
MINLLPEQEKAEIKKEYKLRRVAVALTLLLSVGIIANILFFPSYVLLYYKERNSKAAGRIQPTADQTAERTKLTTEIQISNKILTALKPDTKVRAKLTNIISIIEEDKTNKNIVTTLVYTPSTDGASYQVVVQGIARDRASLQAFVTALRNEPTIAKVDLPISNFAQDTSISYSFTITGKAST